MDLRWTVVDAHRAGAAIDVAVSASPGTTLGDVEASLLAAVGSPPRGRSTLRVDGTAVTATSVIGLPPLLDGAVVVVGPSPAVPELRPTPAALLEAHVVSGPDAGVVVPLAPGTWTVGRSGEAHVRIADPELSRIHVELTVEASGVRVRDAGSTNGTVVDGRPVTGTSSALGGSLIGIGRSTVRVRPPDGRLAELRPDGCGHLLVNRPPHLRPSVATAEISYPAPPSAARAPRLPWPAMLLPLLVSVPLAVWWRQPAFLLFAAMTPVLMLGQHLVDRRTGRRDRGAEEAAYRREVEATDDTLRRAVSDDLARLESGTSDLARLAVIARAPGEMLWCGRPADDGRLDLRLGRGRRPARVVVHRPQEPRRSRHPVPPGPTGPSADPEHDDAPITVDLDAERVVGIAGSRTVGLALARSLIGQVAVTCSPAELTIRVLTSGPDRDEDWAWTAWLPHRDSSRLAVADAGSLEVTGIREVVLLDGVRRLRERPAVSALLRDGPRAGVAVLCLDDDPRKLPLECQATVVATDTGQYGVGGTPAGGNAVYRREGRTPTSVALDLPGPLWAEDVARALARLRDATPAPDDALPSSVSFLDLMQASGIDAARPDAVLAGWLGPEAAVGAATAIGLGDAGPVRLDLLRDGPHVLIGGMTGAGKSELLRSLIFGLAVAHPPDAVSFVLVDYKGGAAFRSCHGLPHVTGVVTDLDHGLAARALTSLRAELRRRERLLAAAGIADISDYAERNARRLFPPGESPPALSADLPPDLPRDLPPDLPRLVVVVDEFRVLAEELPEFVDGLVRIAAVGRSLGVHLVLATQRPAGIVSADIRANTNLRVALRVRDRADSEDIVDGPQASTLPADLPGRAVVRTGDGAPVVVQVARLSGGPRSGGSPSVTRLDRALRPVEAAPPAVDGAGRRDVESVLDAVVEAAVRRGMPPPPTPWLPPLPSRLSLAGLLRDVAAPEAAGRVKGGDAAIESSLPTATDVRLIQDDIREPTGLVFGVADDPGNQRWITSSWELSGRHLAVAGGPRSGRSTTLRTLAISASRRRRETHVYGIDTSGGLLSLTDLPHVGAVVAASDVERADRLLRRVVDEIDRRRFRGRPDRPGIPAADEPPDVVLLVDGWEATTEAWAAYEHGRLVETLLDILRGGGAVGVHVAVTGDRAILSGAPASLLSERLLLRFADPLTATLAGVPASRLAADQPPGRAFRLTAAGEVLDVQVATTAPGERWARAGIGDRHGAPWRLPALPVRVERAEILAHSTPAGTGDGTITVGLAVEDRTRATGPGLGPAGLDLPPGALAAVLGSPGSGRSTALAVIAVEARRLGRDVVLLSRDTRWERLAASGVRVLSPAGRDVTDHLGRALPALHEPLVLVDDAETVAEDLSCLIVQAITGSRVPASAAVATTASAVLGTFGGLLGTLRGCQGGLMLGEVRAGDGDALGVRIGPAPAGPRGRGRLVRRGRSVAVQVMLPDIGQIEIGQVTTFGRDGDADPPGGGHARAPTSRRRPARARF